MKYNIKVVLAYFSDIGLPKPEVEFFFSPHRKWRFDFAWPLLNVALEVEGGAWSGGRHTRGSGFVKDMEKYNTATMLGWRVLRVQPKDLCMLATAQMIRATMEQDNL